MIKILKSKAEIIGTVKLSIPKRLICSRNVEIMDINIMLLFIAKFPNKLTKINVQRVVKNIVDVPNIDFF